MSAPGITVLKNNVPWGPFTHAQIEDGLSRGDFTVKYLAHAPGLKEWLPLGEVIDYVDKAQAPAPSLPPVPVAREFPPIPEPKPAPPPRPPTLPESRRVVEPSAPTVQPSIPASPPVVKKIETPREARPELVTASFALRAFAFVIDCTILFAPIGVLYLIGALVIEIPGAWNHISHQARMDEWDHLKQLTWQLTWLVAIGLGWLYGAGMESSPTQATIGKRWMGIKVTDAQGERISFLRATGRCGAKYLSALPCFLGFILALFSMRGRTLHDRLADTRVMQA